MNQHPVVEHPQPVIASPVPPDEHRVIELHRFLAPHLDRQRDSDFLDRLGESLLTQGAMHPVRCTIEPVDGVDLFRVLSGWSKVLAGRRVGITRLPAVVIHRRLEEAEEIIDTLVENDLRADTAEVDKYRGYARLRELKGWSLAEIARAMHKPPSEITKTFARCEKIPPDLVEQIGCGEGKLCPRGAYALSQLHPDDQKQRELAEKSMKGLLKVERLEEVVQQILGKTKRQKARPLRIKYGGVQMVAITPTLDGLQSFAESLLGAVKKLMKDGDGIEFLSSRLRGP